MPEPSNPPGSPLPDVFDVGRKTVIVTGASSGIGRHFAKVFLDAGADVVATGRRDARLAAKSTPTSAPSV